MKNIFGAFKNFRVLAVVSVLPVLCAAMVLVGCNRSPQYVREQEYYRSDEGYEDERREDSAARSERFGAPKKKIFVFPFENLTPYEKPAGSAGGADDVGAYLADELTRSIGNTGKAIMPENTVSAAHSRDFFSGEKVRVASLVRESRKLNISMAIIGRIKRIRYRQKGDPVGLLRQRRAMAMVEMEMRVFDVTEGKEVITETLTGDSSSNRMNVFNREESDTDVAGARRDLINEAVRAGAANLAKSVSRVLDKISWEGRIAKISGPYIYVNAGRASGLALGDILKVITQGEDVYDPLTGNYMGRSKGQVKGTLEVVEFMGNDGAVTKIHSGAGFTESDAVQLY